MKFVCIYYDGNYLRAKLTVLTPEQSPFGLTPEMVGLTSNEAINAMVEVDESITKIDDAGETDDTYIVVFKDDPTFRSTVRTLELDRAEQEAIDNL